MNMNIGTLLHHILNYYSQYAVTREDVEAAKLMRKYKEKIFPHLYETFMWITTHKECPSAEEHIQAQMGCEFHKGFRQTDIIPSGAEDMIIWRALASTPSSVFWDAFAKAWEDTPKTFPPKRRVYGWIRTRPGQPDKYIHTPEVAKAFELAGHNVFPVYVFKESSDA